MSSEEITQLELRLTKAMGEMEVRLTNAIHRVRTDLSREVSDLRSDVSRLGGLRNAIAFLGAIDLLVGGAVIKYLLACIYARLHLSTRPLLSPPTRLNSHPNPFHGLTPTATCCRRIRGYMEAPGLRLGA